MTRDVDDRAPLLQLHHRGFSKMDITLYSVGTLLLAIAIPVAGGFLLSSVGGGGGSDWFKQLRKPSWTPPNWVFPVMWTTLYILIGVASWLVWRKGGFRGEALALGLYAFQLLLNFLWTPLFFGLHRLDVALADIILLWLAVAATMYFFFRASTVAGGLLVPYLLWVTVATVLNGCIWKDNPLDGGHGDLTAPLHGGPTGGGGIPSA